MNELTIVKRFLKVREIQRKAREDELKYRDMLLDLARERVQEMPGNTVYLGKGVDAVKIAFRHSRVVDQSKAARARKRHGRRVNKILCLGTVVRMDNKAFRKAKARERNIVQGCISYKDKSPSIEPVVLE